MRVIRNTGHELVISAFSRGLFAFVLMMGAVIGYGVYISVKNNSVVLFYVLVPLVLIFLFFSFGLVITTSRASFSRRTGLVTLRSRNLLWRRTRFYPLDMFRHAKVHTLNSDSAKWEVVLVFDERILFDPDLFDSDALEKHHQESAEAGRAPNEISMTAGSDSLFSFRKKERIARAINAWSGIQPVG